MHHLKEFSIELELNKNYWTTLQDKYKTTKFDLCSQSSKIYEACNFHKWKDAKEIFAEIEEYYKDKFPIGEDRLLSGGVHLHTWAQKTPQAEVNPVCKQFYEELYSQLESY